MTNYEKYIKEITIDKLAADMMCPYDGEGKLPCIEDAKLQGHCVKCCKDWLMKEAESDS